MQFRLRTLKPGQFRISSLLIATTLVAIVFGVLRLPSGIAEKTTALSVLFLCLRCWQTRKYLHPLQGNISFSARRKIAPLDFFTSIFPWPIALMGFYFWQDRSSHSVWFSDIVLCGSLAVLFTIASWKLMRALQPKTVWINTI